LFIFFADCQENLSRTNHTMRAFNATFGEQDNILSVHPGQVGGIEYYQHLTRSALPTNRNIQHLC
jgi:hypothetical protein